MIYTPFFRAMRDHNPVIIVPLMLPMALYGSRSVEGAVLFGIAVPVILLLTAILVLFSERFLPPHATSFALMVVAVIFVTALEWFFAVIEFSITPLGMLLFRATVVSGILVQPGFLGGRREPKTPRFIRISGAILSYSLILLVLTLTRVAFRVLGVQSFGGVAVGFIILAIFRFIFIRAQATNEEVQ